MHETNDGNRMGAGDQLAALYGLGHKIAQQTHRRSGHMPPPSAFLQDHVAVTNHGNGVGSENLANFVECFANYTGSRVMGTGKRQYEVEGTGHQRFEDLGAEDLCDELLDELADSMAYISMLAVKVLAMRRGL